MGYMAGRQQLITVTGTCISCVTLLAEKRGSQSSRANPQQQRGC